MFQVFEVFFPFLFESPNVFQLYKTCKTWYNFLEMHETLSNGKHLMKIIYFSLIFKIKKNVSRKDKILTDIKLK